MDPRWRRPRRNEPPSIGTMVSAAVVAFGTYRLANWAWNTWYCDSDQSNKNEAPQRHSPAAHSDGSGFRGDQPLDSVRAPSMNPHRWRIRRQRMSRCRDEVMKALEGFLPTLKKQIEERTNTNKESLALKELRAQRNQDDEASQDSPGEQARRREEKDNWEAIKIKAITRMVATAYAQCILFLVVTVQVNLLGGKLFEEQLQNTSSASSMSIDSVASDRMNAYGESHKLVLQYTYKYFFERGIVSLIDSVERVVSDVLRNWDVSDPSSLNISKEAFDQAINDIRAAEERGRVSSRSRRPRSLLRFLLPPSESFDANVHDELARWILDETWDLLESPVLIDAQQDCLKRTFERMRDHYWGKIFEEENDEGIPRHAANRTVTRPLAHVVTRLKHTSKSFFKPQQQATEDMILGMAAPRFTVNSYCAEMEMLPSVLELADVSFN